MKLILASGFLGSGKTTAIVAACQRLIQQGRKVAVITNDQGDQQVDTLLIGSRGIPVAHVANGCFCCKYDELGSRISEFRLSTNPDVIFAESVGSCTDLVATIARPLIAAYPEIHITRPAFLDAELMISILEGRSAFTEESIRYIFRKQLEEADVIVVSKIDRINSDQISRLRQVLNDEYPGKSLLFQSSFDQTDVSRWLAHIEQMPPPTRRSLDIDYDIYADGEARLAWMDESIEIRCTRSQAVFVSERILASVFHALQERGYAIGHLKFFLEGENWSTKVSFTSMSTSRSLKLEATEGNSVRMLINARVGTSPGELQALVDGVLRASESIYGCTIIRGKSRVFSPGYPRPTHRIAD